MMELLFNFLAIVCLLLSLIISVRLAQSRIKFTKGEIQKIIEDFIWGTIFLFGFIAASFQVEVLNLRGSLIDLIKYLLLIIALIRYMMAANRIHNLSKVFGFASEQIPKKLKKVLKS